MAWYDVFSSFYDSSLEELYRESRIKAAEVLDVRGASVLDLPCGTGQSFEPLLTAGARCVVGGDRSVGMLSKATKRIEKMAVKNVTVVDTDVLKLSPQLMNEHVSGGRFDRVHIFLGLSAFDDWQQAFDHLWSCLLPGGRCVVVDVYNEKPGIQGHLVNWIAQADIRRKTWEPLQQRSNNYEKVILPKKREYGGDLYLATGVKPKDTE